MKLLPKLTMRNKIKIILLGIILMSCRTISEPLEKLFSFPNDLSEISAVEMTRKSDWIWTLEDSGNEPKLYAFNLQGQETNTLTIKNIQNTDWEELTSDDEGNLYIGDFGNNNNMRQDLCIYKINASQLRNKEADVAAKIGFNFPEQTQFPPDDAHKYYDLEAFFLFGDRFYLFTKNRSSESDGTTFMYTVPNIPGNHAAKLVGEFKTCHDFHDCAITSADMSPDGKKVALLSNSHVWIFSDFKSDHFFEGKVQQIDFADFTHKEGICFAGNSKLFVTDERKKNKGGNLYLLNLSHLKSKS